MLLTQRYSEQIAGVISCYDRVVIQGTLPGWRFDGGMTAFLNVNKIRIFDYPQFANTLREELRSHAEAIAAENNIEIEFIRKIDAFRKTTGQTSGTVLKGFNRKFCAQNMVQLLVIS